MTTPSTPSPEPENSAQPNFTQPGFTQPDFTQPDFTQPDDARPNGGQPDPRVTYPYRDSYSQAYTQQAFAATTTRTTRSAQTRRTVAIVAAGTLLTGVVGWGALGATRWVVASQQVTGSTSTTQVQGGLNQGGSGQSGTGGSYGGYGQGGSGGYGQGSTSGQSGSGTTATAKQSTGVAIIDTVLSNGEAAGTGIVLSANGEILTNYHVVEQSTSIKVTIASTGKTYVATVVGDDPTKDVALLQLTQASGLAVATLDDDPVTVGAKVTAVGNAGGTGTLTAATGTITGLSKSITTQAEASAESENLTGLLETDAGIVAGDSGGPLLDSEGEVTGIDTAASSGGQADGYAIPIASALTIVQQIQSGEETAQVRIGPAAFLGVQVADSTQTGGSRYGNGYGNGAGSADASTSGATVAGVVDGGAAAQAGLSAGDVITKVGSARISTADELTTALATKEPGDQVKITWTTTDGQTESATVTLGSSPIN